VHALELNGWACGFRGRHTDLGLGHAPLRKAYPASSLAAPLDQAVSC
jgi:hypothetical protein